MEKNVFGIKNWFSRNRNALLCGGFVGCVLTTGMAICICQMIRGDNRTLIYTKDEEERIDAIIAALDEDE